MADLGDIKLWKMEKAWNLASRMIPERYSDTGEWTEDNYLKKAQETLKEAYSIVNAVFRDEPSPAPRVSHL